MKICVITLGCPKNIVDSEYLMAKLFNRNVQFVAQAHQSDVVIINTCAFIVAAREEAVEVILEAVRLKAAGIIKQIYVTGCLPQRYLHELRTEIPEVDGYFAEYDFCEIGRQLSRQLQLNSPYHNNRRLLPQQHHFAYLKISEGCDNRCRYCTIPSIKGEYRARPMTELVDEAMELADAGVKELILVAQDTTYYGWKQGNKKLLFELIQSLARIKHIGWIRILYAHPGHVADGIIDLYRTQKKLCRYIDLPIQHISDRILTSMGRQISEIKIKKLIERLRKNVSELAIRTTLMVGYPGETQQDFDLLREFVIATEFDRLGVFKYSPEPGTDAADIPDQVDEAAKEDRYQELMEIQSEISYRKNQRLINQTIPVMIDEYDKTGGHFLGRTEWDSPMIDNTVHVTGDAQVGHIYQVTIDQVSEYDLWGKIQSKEGDSQ